MLSWAKKVYLGNSLAVVSLGIGLAKYVFQQPDIQMLDLVHLSSFLVDFEGDYATILDFKVT